MINKKALAVAKHGSTSSSEDPTQIKHINMTSDVSLKQQLRKRYNNLGGNNHHLHLSERKPDHFSKN